MNQNHAQLCPSPEWASHIQGEVLPYLVKLATLGDTMLELGPGPGAATEWLRRRVRHLVALEADSDAATTLSKRYVGTNVEVVLGDATDMTFPTNTFDSVGSFTMLHHVSTVSRQQMLLQEAFRVLKPGGYLLGSDSVASNELHLFHVGDDYNPVDPASLLIRLQAIGFVELTIAVDGILTFVARKPDESTKVNCNGNEKENNATSLQ